MNQFPHGYAGAVRLDVLVHVALDALAFQPIKRIVHMAHRLRRIRRGQAVQYFKWDAAGPCQMQQHIAVLPAGVGDHQRLFKKPQAHIRRRFQPLDCGLLQIAHSSTSASQNFFRHSKQFRALQLTPVSENTSIGQAWRNPSIVIRAPG